MKNISSGIIKLFVKLVGCCGLRFFEEMSSIVGDSENTFVYGKNSHFAYGGFILTQRLCYYFYYGIDFACKLGNAVYRRSVQ